MNVYHQVLVRLYEETEGKSGKSVNLMNLAKSLGLHGNYANIFEQLSSEGWIAEGIKADFVVITPDGIREAKKSLSNSGGDNDARQQIVRNSNRAASLATELAALLETQAQNPTQDFAETLKKMAELQTTVTQIKTSFS